MTTTKDNPFDVLIVGGGASGLSCALTLGSGLSKPFAQGKRVALLAHQKGSSMQRAIFNNVLGLPPGTLGAEVLQQGMQQLRSLYPEVTLIEGQKALRITPTPIGFTIETTHESIEARQVVLAIGSGQPFSIAGLEAYIQPHAKARPEKNRIQLQHHQQLVMPNLYVVGTLAGERSQLAIAMGSGAAVAADLMTEWNQGQHVQIHDALPVGH